MRSDEEQLKHPSFSDRLAQTLTAWAIILLLAGSCYLVYVTLQIYSGAIQIPGAAETMINYLRHQL